MASLALLLFDEEPTWPEGFVYRPDFLSEAEEAGLLRRISRLEFGDVRMHGVVARRRVIQYGWRYSFDGRTLDIGEPVPEFIRPVLERVADAVNRPSAELAEVLLTEYRPGATIGWHRDAAPFGLVAGVSLGAPCRFRLRRAREGGSWDRLEVIAESRSLYVLDGPARRVWEHSIPAVADLRYSLTFRTLRASRHRD